MEKEVRKIIQVGNSLGITLSRKMRKQNGLKKGDYLRLDKITKVNVVLEEVKIEVKQQRLDKIDRK